MTQDEKTIADLQRRLTAETQKRAQAQHLVTKMQAKLAKQTSEIGRLGQKLEACAAEKRQILAELRAARDARRGGPGI